MVTCDEYFECFNIVWDIVHGRIDENIDYDHVFRTLKKYQEGYEKIRRQNTDGIYMLQQFLKDHEIPNEHD